MIDISFVKANPGSLDDAMRKRGKPEIEAEVLEIERDFRWQQTKLQQLLEKRNAITAEFAKCKIAGKDGSELSRQVSALKKEIQEQTERVNQAKSEYIGVLETIPNIPSGECPVGPDEDSNLEVRRFKTPKEFDFEPIEHYEVGARLGMMDFERAVKIAGARFVLLFSDLARMERSLSSFMLDIHTKEHGYTEVYVPLILGQKAMYGVGQLPKFEEDVFKTTMGSYLIPTSEASLTNIHGDELLREDELPIRYTAYTPCFRSEAGAAGRDTAGMLRQHQFGKVEMVSITTPGQAIEEHERMTACAEEILKRLDLPFRTVVLSTGDMGFASEKTYDLEVWLPGQKRYREISSCSRCGTFQARRMNTRFKCISSKKNEFVHTLNGSGIAVGRCLIAILENYQQSDGSIIIPEKLIPYFGKDKISAQILWDK
ncbi:MAG: serine--tRNA ligase [Holosporales bacterium]|jgi:seryl-tRNA synthetase|nr:serine--tRNA ligase [Holosporales bacterium]